MNKLDKIDKLSLMFYIYKDLLTEIQVDVFTQYYLEDLSLSEIAESTNTSRASISLKLKDIEKKLLTLDSKLSLVDKFNKIDKIILELEEKGENKIAKKLRELNER